MSLERRNNQIKNEGWEQINAAATVMQNHDGRNISLSNFWIFSGRPKCNAKGSAAAFHHLKGSRGGHISAFAK